MRLRQAAWQARSRARRWMATRTGGAQILLYHRVSDLADDPQLLAVHPDRFRAHMELLAEEYHPIALDQAARLSAEGELPDRAVAVTFDDGYADNLHEAEPILKATGVPATVFVATGYVESGNEYWWDELEQLLLGEQPRPERLQLRWEAERRDFDTASPAQCQATYGALHPLLREGPIARREELLVQLRSWAGLPAEGSTRPTHRPLTIEELQALHGSPVVALAPHTRAHPSLAREAAEIQREEIAGSAADLERWVGERSPIFSYPFGVPGHDYTPKTVDIVRELGFEWAVSTSPGTLSRLSSRWEVPRTLVRDWQAAELEQRLAPAHSSG